MGVAIGKLIENCKEKFNLDSSLKNKQFGVDAYNVLYQFVTTIRGIDGMPLKNEQGKITSHLNGIFYRMLTLLSTGAEFVFVFDGKSNKLKEKTKQERRERRTIAKEKLEFAIDQGHIENMHKYSIQSATIDENIIEESKELLNAMGISYINAPSEAEAQISYLTSKGIFDYTVSSDYDCLLFNSPNLVRNLTASGKKKVPYKNIYIDISPEIITSKCVFEKIGLTRKKLIWLSLLVGTDFNKKVEGIGPKTAYKLVNKYDSFQEIEKYLKEKGKQFYFDYKEIENIFLNPDINKNPKIISGNFNRNKIEKILIEKSNFSKDRIKNSLDKYITKKENRDRQKTIDKWF
jgi:flap endonuclease-1